ncbi:fumarylacetoacetate hydrolase family protein [Sneathiella litorea]|uniref:2-hydroxyhepta-2,4-diene-1,7-dioate isomerase n=1 Tax=Sneathiella litorea TaxID=2606216 RepID=A0A6L8W9N4_9PROT|nr:fumarylacetoacetate hydrolase family protein [Sneathiella litorea]MZR31223.1 2-hydroxyhepta-2,4-diene-1,7-dioate isomerase [Sneathiella litorea]
MKLVRYGEKGAEKPGILDASGKIRDLSGIVDDIDGTTIAPTSLEKLASVDIDELPVVNGQVRLGACVGNVGKIVCVGLNYSDHAKEANLPIPKEPIIFMKATTSINGPYDDVELPASSTKLDWEVELGFAIGKRAKNVSEADALDYVAGYFIVNELSEREWQAEREGQWTKGKSHDTFAPLGPWFVTADEIADPGDLNLKLAVNGETRQNGSTKTMIFGVAEVLSYISGFMTLEPGDVISTGTPPGVGLGMKPPLYLKDGDRMHLEINGLGHQQQLVVKKAE